MRRRKVLYVCDALGVATAGGPVAARRLIEALEPHHEVCSLGVGGSLPMRSLRLPVGDGLVRKNSFVFARPDEVAIRRAVAWAEVVHLQFPSWLSFRVLRWARTLGVPVVSAHHLQPENVLHQTGLHLPGLARWLNRVLVRHHFQWTDAVVCPTRFARDELVQAGLAVRAEVISNGVPSRFRPAAQRAPSARFRIVSVGRHAPEKKQRVLIEAVLRMRHREQVELVVGGKGPLTGQLQQLARPLGPAARIGFLDDAQLLDTFQQADLMVHPSEVELEGLAVAEAIACGTPAMVSDARSNAAVEFALDERFVFPASRPEALAERLDRWVEDRRTLEGLRELAARRGEQVTLEASAARMASLYDEVSGRRYHAPVRDGRPRLLAATGS